MKIYKVSVDDYKEKYFVKEQKAIEYGLKCLDKAVHREWERKDACETYGVTSWDEAKKLMLDDAEYGIQVEKIEVIE